MTLGECSCLREPGCDAVANVAADRKNANSAPMHSFRSVFIRPRAVACLAMCIVLKVRVAIKRPKPVTRAVRCARMLNS